MRERSGVRTDRLDPEAERRGLCGCRQCGSLVLPRARLAGEGGEGLGRLGPRVLVHVPVAEKQERRRGLEQPRGLRPAEGTAEGDAGAASQRQAGVGVVCGVGRF